MQVLNSTDWTWANLFNNCTECNRAAPSMSFPTLAVYFGSCPGSATALKISNITGIRRTQRWKNSIFSFFSLATRLQYSLFHACYTNHNWQVSIYLKLFLVGPFSFSVISNQILSAASFHYPSNLSLAIPASKQKELADLGTSPGNSDRTETNQGSLSCTEW